MEGSLLLAYGLRKAVNCLLAESGKRFGDCLAIHDCDTEHAKRLYSSLSRKLSRLKCRNTRNKEINLTIFDSKDSSGTCVMFEHVRRRKARYDITKTPSGTLRQMRSRHGNAASHERQRRPHNTYKNDILI
jgi:hypothetical protein